MTPEGDLAAEAAPAPETVQPASQEDILSDISDLLDAPETPDRKEPEEEKPAAEEPFDPLGDEAEDVDPDDVDDTTEDDNGPDDLKGGRYAPDSAKVKIGNETITIGDLKARADERIKDFQRGFTEKTTALAKDKETFEAERQKVAQYAQSLSISRDQIAFLAEHFLPKQPKWDGDAAVDPHGYQIYLQEKERWETATNAYRAVAQQKQSEAEKKSTETAQQAQARLAEEDNKLVAALPFLKDPEKYKLFQTTMEAGAAKHYGLSPQQLWGVGSHVAILAMRDALAYRRLKEAAPQVKEAAKRPALKGDSHRADPRERNNRGKESRTEVLRKTGRFDAGVEALKDFDL